jgi:hypothetical protein
MTECRYYIEEEEGCDILAQGLIGFIGLHLFSEAHLERTPKLGVVGLERWVTDDGKIRGRQGHTHRVVTEHHGWQDGRYDDPKKQREEKACRVMT